MLLVTLAKKVILMAPFYLPAALPKHIGISPPPSNGGPIWLRKSHYCSHDFHIKFVAQMITRSWRN
jgi:hypothetical protein